MATKRTPARCSVYPSVDQVRKIANSLHRGYDPEGKSRDDYEQELHLKACELLFQNRDRPLKFVYRCLWNHGRNMRRHARMVSRKKVELADDADLEWMATYSIEKDLEDRACLRVLDKALSPAHMATLTYGSEHTRKEAMAHFGLSHEGWRRRLNRARAEARAALA